MAITDSAWLPISGRNSSLLRSNSAIPVMSFPRGVGLVQVLGFRSDRLGTIQREIPKPKAQGSNGVLCALSLVPGLSEACKNLERRVDSPGRSGDMDPLNRALQCAAELAGNRDTLRRSRVGARRAPHPFEHRLRNAHTRNLVRHELGVEDALERPEPYNNGKTRRFDPAEQPLERRDVEHRLRHHELSAGLDLVLEAANLVVQVLGARVHLHADVKRGRTADRLSADV